MFNFKKDKEYIILLKTNKTLRIIVTKVVKLPDESLDVQSKDCLSNWDFNFNNEKLNCLEIIEPVNNSELFIMYINWNNFYRNGFNQDLEYAEQVRQSILKTLLSRSYVKQGSGKLELYDLSLLQKMFPKHCKEDFHLDC